MSIKTLKWAAILSFIVAMVILVGGRFMMSKELPPYPGKVVDPNGRVLFGKSDIIEGQNVYQRYGLMDHGAVWGHGSQRGSEFSATSLHLLAEAMRDYLAAQEYGTSYGQLDDLRKEIIDVNIKGTRNVLEAAAAESVKKIVYVSSTFTLDHNNVPMNETGWNSDYSDPYSHSKTEAEKVAWDLAGKLDLWMVSILPSGMVGPHCYGHLTPTMGVISKILTNQLPFDPEFNFNLVDIRDVADGMITAAKKGECGVRYILAQEHPISSTEAIEFAHSLYPDTKIPSKAPYFLMRVLAFAMEYISKITRKEPLMLRSHVKKFYKSDFRYNTSKAKTKLGFKPRPSKEALEAAFAYLADQE